ncbi:MAG: ribonuclease HI [Dehalococcoidales bacterium]|nr:ribonuclease HI [Dehalococcoidales bacterium]
MMNMIAHVRYLGQEMCLKTPYNASFVAELKNSIKAKKWDPEKKEWIIDVKERTKALELVKRFYDLVEDNQMPEIPQLPQELLATSRSTLTQTNIDADWLAGGNLEIWTDGACLGNPGPGGYGIVFKCNGQTKVKSGGFKLTTNNRMEILAAIVALETLKNRSNVVIYSDSQYLVDSIMQGWAKKWKANNWKRNKKDKAINPDLWDRLLQLCEQHNVEFKWIKGHDFKTENEWCDQLAEAAANQPNLPVDAAYELDNNKPNEESSPTISQNKMF